MKISRSITFRIIAIALLAIIASAFGIFSQVGSGPFQYETIRGQVVTISGRGLYKHMTADVAIQGIAQDYITLFVSVPLMLLFLTFAQKGNRKGMILLTGTIGYLLLTYTF